MSVSGFIEQMGYAEGVHEDGTFGALPKGRVRIDAPKNPLEADTRDKIVPLLLLQEELSLH
jgi:hypothetical protein